MPRWLPPRFRFDRPRGGARPGPPRDDPVPRPLRPGIQRRPLRAIGLLDRNPHPLLLLPQPHGNPPPLMMPRGQRRTYTKSEPVPGTWIITTRLCSQNQRHFGSGPQPKSTLPESRSPHVRWQCRHIAGHRRLDQPAAHSLRHSSPPRPVAGHGGPALDPLPPGGAHLPGPLPLPVPQVIILCVCMPGSGVRRESSLVRVRVRVWLRGVRVAEIISVYSMSLNLLI